MRVVVTTPPASTPVSLAQAKAQCRATGFDDDDTLISGLINTATQWIDGPAGWLGRCLVQQSLELRLDAFWPPPGEFQHLLMHPWEAGRIFLPYGPLISVDSISYVDPNGDTQTMDSSTWLATGIGTVDGAVEPAWNSYWPLTRWQREGIRIGYTAGYAAPSGAQQPPPNPVPATVQQAMLLLGEPLVQPP